MSLLKGKIKVDLAKALKDREGESVSVLRLLLSDIHNQEIQKKRELSDDEVLGVLQGRVKKHQDSISQFAAGNRADLVEKERSELALIQAYLPEPLSGSELRALVKEIITEVQAAGAADFGKVMKALMPKVKGRAAGILVSQIVKEELK